MSQTKESAVSELGRDTVLALREVNGVHLGFRPAHAKGLLVGGVFTPAPQAQSLTNAPHITRPSTPVTVRFSDFAGIPNIPDNSLEGASPRGCVIRFHLAEHSHTDIVAHSVDGFPTETAQGFVEFLRAIAASGPGTAEPTPLQQFLKAHPSALEFVMKPKPIPVSFVKESYFAVNAYKFTNADHTVTFGRYRIRPEGDPAYLTDAEAAAQTSDFLFDDLTAKLRTGPLRIRIYVQVANGEDRTDNSTVHWPAERREVEFGTVELHSILPDNQEEQRHLIFDPVPRVPGIEPSDDPLIQTRAEVYLDSGHRRRAGV